MDMWRWYKTKKCWQTLDHEFVLDRGLKSKTEQILTWDQVGQTRPNPTKPDQTRHANPHMWPGRANPTKPKANPNETRPMPNQTQTARVKFTIQGEIHCPGWTSWGVKFTVQGEIHSPGWNSRSRLKFMVQLFCSFSSGKLHSFVWITHVFFKSVAFLRKSYTVSNSGRV